MILQQPAQSNYDLKFQLFRVPVRVHPGFWIICLFFNMPQYGERFQLDYFAAGTALVFVSILVHEFGHAMSARFFGERRNSVILYSMGGLCVHEDFRPKPMQQIWSLLWGPFSGFVFGIPFLAAFFGVRFGVLPSHGITNFLIFNGMLINFGWGIVNLFPVFPLDGGQILREFIRWKQPRKGDAFVCTVSIVTGGLLAVLGLIAHLFFKTGLFAPLLFGILAYQNYLLRKQIIAMGPYYGQEEEAPRQAWEQDPDWWKRG